MEHTQEHTTPLSLNERISTVVKSAYGLIEARGTYAFASGGRIGYFDGENGEADYTIEEKNRLHIHLETGVGYGNGFSSSTTIAVTSQDTAPVILGSFHEWPNKNTQIAEANGARLVDPQEIEHAVSYVEFVMSIAQADIAKQALRKQAQNILKLPAFTKEFELEVGEDVYFRHFD